MKEKTDTVYKVVGKDLRYGTNITMFLHRNENIETLLERLKELPDHYKPRYFKGKTVHASPFTVGLMAFEKEKDAKEFMYLNFENNECIIIKGKAKIINRAPDVLLMIGCGSNPFNLLTKTSRLNSVYPFPGTVFCSEITALE